MVRSYRRQSKTSRAPARRYDKERMEHELKLVGEFGLRNKREVYRINYALAKVRSAARHLLTLREEDPQRAFNGAALLRRLTRYGLLTDGEDSLEFCLGLTPRHFLSRRLQTLVWRLNIAKSAHDARCLIVQKHIGVNKQLVNRPGFMVRTLSEGLIDYDINSPFAPNGKPGRVAKKKGTTKQGEESD
eukprot:GHVH01011478.1.p1 GENE.GHVH01011478.1~~GHVH01011478.1.p1  ORF type:complete len:188 (+),score=23.12 GHVH01011478.1:39-602(+)